jgi:hypothetical protein
MSDQPENPVKAHCGAKTRVGHPCRRWPMPNGRCRLHGCSSPGPRTPEGLARLRAARTTHGNRTAQARELRVMIRKLKADQKRLTETV